MAKFDRDSVDLSKYKTAGTSLSRVSGSVVSSAATAMGSPSPAAMATAAPQRRSMDTRVMAAAHPHSRLSTDHHSTSMPQPKSLVHHSMPPQSLDRVSGKPPMVATTSLGRESRIREMQRQAAATSAMRRSSVSSQGSIEENPTDIETLSFEIQILDAETKAPVAFKFDGQRFHMKETVKLYTGRQYNIIMKISPEIPLREQVVTIDAQVAGTGGSKALMSDGLYMDREAGGHHVGVWDCKLPKSGKGERTSVRIAMDVKDFCRVSFPVSVKIYGGKDTSGQHGSVLKTIMYKVKKAANVKGSATIIHSQFVEGG